RGRWRWTMYGEKVSWRPASVEGRAAPQVDTMSSCNSRASARRDRDGLTMEADTGLNFFGQRPAFFGQPTGRFVLWDIMRASRGGCPLPSLARPSLLHRLDRKDSKISVHPLGMRRPSAPLAKYADG